MQLLVEHMIQFITYIPYVMISAVLVIAAVIDLRSQRIPNILTFSAMATSLLYFILSRGTQGFVYSTTGLIVGIAVLIVPYLLGGMGAGDAKLMGAVGAALGVKGVFIAFLLSAMAGGIYALILVIWKRNHFRGFFKNKLLDLKLFFLTRKYTPDARDPSQPRLCYGLAIAVGSITYMLLDASGYAFPI